MDKLIDKFWRGGVKQILTDKEYSEVQCRVKGKKEKHTHRLWNQIVFLAG